MIPLPGDYRKSTQPIKDLVAELNRVYPTAGSMGIYNRRPIASSSTWSQHSWGNAVDITSPPGMLKPRLYATAEEAAQPIYAGHMAYLDDVYAFLRQNSGRLGVRYIAWRKYMHRNHIHVDMNPHKTGVPPILTPLPTEDDIEMKKGDEGKRVVVVQKQLMDLGYSLPQWGADGDFGTETELAVKEFQIDRDLPVDGVLYAVDLGLLFRLTVTAHNDTVARAEAQKAHDRLDKLHEV